MPPFRASPSPDLDAEVAFDDPLKVVNGNIFRKENVTVTGSVNSDPTFVDGRHKAIAIQVNKERH